MGGVLLSVAGSIPGKNKTVTLTFIHGYLYMVIVPIHKRTVMNGTSPRQILVHILLLLAKNNLTSCNLVTPGTRTRVSIAPGCLVPRTLYQLS